MKIDFRPAGKFPQVLVGEATTNDNKTVNRYFAYMKSSRNKSIQHPRVMRQEIRETKRGWLVTDMEVFDSNTGRVIKSLKRTVDKDGNFVTKLMTLGLCGNKNFKTIEHLKK